MGARTLNVTAGHSNNNWYWRDPTIVYLPRLARRDTIVSVHLAKQHTRCALIWTSAGRLVVVGMEGARKDGGCEEERGKGRMRRERGREGREGREGGRKR